MRIFFIILLFLGCNSHNTKKEENLQKELNITKKSVPKKEKKNITILNLKEINLTFKENRLIYPKQKIYILFNDKSNYSKMQEQALKYLKVNYVKTDNEFLKKYFQIDIYPTIVILDKNKTTKLENFTPIEILKGF